MAEPLIPLGKRAMPVVRPAPAGDGPRVYVETYGCQMNVADSDLIGSVLAGAGYGTTTQAADADVILINTCAVREKAEERVIARATELGSLKRKRPGMVLAVVGCMAEHLKEGLATRAPAIDVIAGPDSYRRMPELLAAASTGRDHAGPQMDVRLDKSETYEGISGAEGGDGVSGFVTIQRGCDKFCTFCVVPFTRGRERGAAPREVLRQVRELAQAGYREVTLLGQTVNSYRWPQGPPHHKSSLVRDFPGSSGEAQQAGSDRERARSDQPSPSSGISKGHRTRRYGDRESEDESRELPGPRSRSRSTYDAAGPNPEAGEGDVTFADLLRAVVRIDGIERVRFTSPYPVDFTADVIAALAEEPKLCKHVHLPVQSGSDAVLDRMRRGYSVADFRAIVTALRAAMPEIALSTDILSGFSGETEADHRATLDLMRDVRFDTAFMFAYSERDLTFAAKKLPDDVAPDVKARRLAEIVDVQNRISAGVFASHVDRRERVLVTGPSKRDPAQLIGRTDGFKTVILPAGVGAVGEFVDVTIRRANMATLFA